MTRRWARVILGIGVAGVFLALLVRRVDVEQVRRVLAGAAATPLLLGLLALSGDMIARIVRWRWMLRAAQPDLSFGACARPFLASLALNNTLPFRAGDMARVVGFQRSLRAPLAHVAGTLVLERILDLLTLLAILFVSLAGGPGRFPRAFLVAGALAGVTALAALLVLTFAAEPLTRVMHDRIAGRLAGRTWFPAARRIVNQLIGALALLRSPAMAARLVGLSLVAWALEGTVFACVAWSLGLGMPWPAPWLALAAATLATLLPGTPGYVGTFDYFASLGLTAWGVPATGAAAFAVLTHFLLWAPVTAAGLLALVVGRFRRGGAPGLDPLRREEGMPA
jgi:glycosyltransferase 2 family protein